MLTDGNRGATLTYNYLNLPKTVTIGTKTFTYDYDAAGTKHKYAGDTVNIKYAGTFEYNSTNAFKRLATSEGQLVPSGDTLRFDYFIKDHLGNVRVVFDESGKVIQSTDYYPFGLEIDRNSPVQTPAVRNGINRYNFLGKETQISTGYIDLQARFYDPLTGRFMAVDPMAEKYPSMTPYNYAFNNPLKYIDPDGRDGVLAIKGNTLTISSNIYVYGSGATKATASLMQRDIMAKWDKGFSVKDAAGNSYNVKFDVKVGVYGGKEKADPFIVPENWNPFNRDNFVEVGASLSEVNRSYVKGGDKGEWRGVGRNGMNLSQDNPAAHEFGHMLGLDDRYDDKKGPHPGWENNIMGDSQKGNADQRNINSIVGDAMKAYDTWSKDKNNVGKTFRYEIKNDETNK